ncbi:MAG: hypothetical protein KDC39_06415 [Actinobacteria bacterium]|nr:hypothetical protein [Actinomycetota bacterium]
MAADPDESVAPQYVLPVPQSGSGMSTRFAFVAGIAVGLAFFCGYWIASHSDQGAALTGSAAGIPPVAADGYAAVQTTDTCRDRVDKKVVRKTVTKAGGQTTGSIEGSRDVETGANARAATGGVAVNNGSKSPLAVEGGSEGEVGRDGIVGGNDSVNIIAKDGTSIHFDNGGSSELSPQPTSSPSAGSVDQGTTGGSSADPGRQQASATPGVAPVAAPVAD